MPKQHEAEYEKNLRTLQRGMLAEAVKDIVGMEYGEDELKPSVAALVVFAPDNTVAIWDVNLETGEDLPLAQCNGVLVGALAATATALVAEHLKQQGEEGEG